MNQSIFAKAHNPILQASLILGAALFIMLSGFIANSLNIADVSIGFYWQTISSFMLLYAIFNSIISFAAKDLNQYWLRSILAYVGIVAIGSGCAYLITGKTVNEVDSYRWIFFIITFGFLSFLSITGFIKRILQAVEAEEKRKLKQDEER